MQLCSFIRLPSIEGNWANVDLFYVSKNTAMSLKETRELLNLHIGKIMVMPPQLNNKLIEEHNWINLKITWEILLLLGDHNQAFVELGTKCAINFPWILNWNSNNPQLSVFGWVFAKLILVKLIFKWSDLYLDSFFLKASLL